MPQISNCLILKFHSIQNVIYKCKLKNVSIIYCCCWLTLPLSLLNTCNSHKAIPVSKNNTSTNSKHFTNTTCWSSINRSKLSDIDRRLCLGGGEKMFKYNKKFRFLFNKVTVVYKNILTGRPYHYYMEHPLIF